MQRILISTTSRKANYDESSGHLYVFDLDNWEIIQKGTIIEPPYRDIDPNPRGGFRGGKGIAIYDDQIFLANTVGIFRFNQQWELRNVVTHPSCSGIHEILLDQEKNLWVTSARNDLLFKFDLDGKLLNHFYFRKNHNLDPSIQSEIISDEAIKMGAIDFRDPRTHKLSTYDSLHVNSVSQLPNGNILISLGLVVGKKFSNLMKVKDYLNKRGLWSWFIRINKFIQELFALQKDRHSDLIVQPAKGKSIVALLKTEGELTSCLEIDNVNVPSHSVSSRSDGTAVYLNTTIGNIIHFNPENGQIISSTNVCDKFLRGILQITTDDFIVGSQNSLFLFNIKTLEITKQINLSEDPNEAVFAIHKFPNRFALPPISFETHLGKLVGFNHNTAIFE